MNTLRRIAMETLTLGLLMGGVLPGPGTAWAHEAPCTYCKLGLVQNTDTQDNEVVLKFAGKKFEYRCLFCALADLEKYKGDLLIYAPTEKRGEPAVLKRTGTKWAIPKTLVFMTDFKGHKTCTMDSRAFTSRAAFKAWATKAGQIGATPLTFSEMVATVAEKTKK